MSQKTDTNPRCGDCVNMRKEDGYCGRVGRYVNYFRVACKDYVDRIEAEEEKALASMPEPEEPEVRVKADAKIRRKGILHPDPKPTTKTCKDCGREGASVSAFIPVTFISSASKMVGSSHPQYQRS